MFKKGDLIYYNSEYTDNKNRYGLIFKVEITDYKIKYWCHWEYSIDDALISNCASSRGFVYRDPTIKLGNFMRSPLWKVMNE